MRLKPVFKDGQKKTNFQLDEERMEETQISKIKNKRRNIINDVKKYTGSKRLLLTIIYKKKNWIAWKKLINSQKHTYKTSKLNHEEI